MVFKDSFFRHGSIIFFFSVLGYISGYVFHIYMGRALGPEDYGILGSIIAIINLTTIPAGAIQVSIANFTSKLMIDEDYAKIKFLFAKSLKKLSLYGFFLFVGIVLASPLFTSFLNIQSSIPLILIGLAVIFSFAVPVNFGVMQGIQNFKQLGLGQSLSHIIKLVAGIIFVSLGLGINGAALSFPVATILVFLVTMLSLKNLLKYKSDDNLNKSEIYKYYWSVLVVFAGFMIITNIDIVLAKHLFSAEQAGFYAAASILAKVAFFLSTIITTVMFPKAVDMHSKTDNAFPILKKGIVYVSGLLVIMILAYFTIPDIIIIVLFGSAYLEMAGMIGLLSLAMSFLAVSNVIAYYNMSINRMSFMYIIIAVAFVEVPILFLFHSNTMEFIWMIFFSMAALLISLIIYMIILKKR